MYQTGYKGVQPLSVHLPYNGGFCRWWYTPWGNVEGWPITDCATQQFNGMISVSDPWFGPIKVPSGQLGFSETPKRDKIGLTYEQKISGFYPGDDTGSRINLENMPYDEWIIVGKMRAGGMYLVIGSEAIGAEWIADYKSNGDDVAGSNFGFSFTSLNKAIILPSFDETFVTVPPGATQPPATTPQPEGDMEIITYNSEQQVLIDWNAARQQRFGTMPVIQVWYTEPGAGLKVNPTPIIGIDAAPPAMTLITVTINAPGPGFITLSR